MKSQPLFKLVCQETLTGMYTNCEAYHNILPKLSFNNPMLVYRLGSNTKEMEVKFVITYLKVVQNADKTDGIVTWLIDFLRGKWYMNSKFEWNP